MRVLESNKTFFEVVAPLGEGLNSCVYTAIRTDVQKTFSQKVALKILKSEKDVEAWRLEVASLSRVESIHCVRVLDFEWLNGRPALVLEWVDGLTLDQLHQRALLSNSSLTEIAMQVQQGLADLGLSGLCHGDLNPNNVLISNKGAVKLLDFGLANTFRHTTQGSPAFMAPEVLAGGLPNYGSDIYSLGAVLKYLGLEDKNSLETLMVDRQPLLATSDSETRRLLGELVTSIQEKMAQAKASETQSINISSGKPLGFRASQFLIFIFLSLFLSQADGQRTPNQHCEVALRTQKWVDASLTDRTTQHSPALWIVKDCSPITLKWTSLHGSGSLEVHFKPGERRLITDLDLGL